MKEPDIQELKEICKLLRYYIVTSTTEAGSGHPTSSLSAVELMAVLMYGGFFKYRIDDVKYHNNDRLIFSKGHASPLYYSLWAAAGAISPDELMTLRKFKSRLEGHPTPEFPHAEVATGALGQGLSIGAGMALNAKYLDKLPYQTYVLIGDGETEEGQIWEAIEFADYYKLDNLTAIIDVNRLEQIGETMEGWRIDIYKKKLEAFGWEVITIEDGHDLEQIIDAFKLRQQITGAPVALVAKTIKGKGFSIWENKLNWHSKVLNKEQLEVALRELGNVNKNIKANIEKPDEIPLTIQESKQILNPNYEIGNVIGIRNGYGKALIRIFDKYPNLISLDAGMSNSTFAEEFKAIHPDKYFEMFIAEQNMVSVANGLSKRGKLPFVSTFGSFFTRAFDQIRMSNYSESNIKYVSSHNGVSMGQDGSSQMGLEDIAMFRSQLNSIVLYPSDIVALDKCIELAAEHQGNVYVRMTRKEVPIIYSNEEKFEIGGSKIIRESVYDVFTVVGAGVTLHEALKAYDELAKENISIRVVDLYSIKPLDIKTLTKCIRETKGLLVVEDHYPEGGIGETVMAAFSNSKTKIFSLAVTKMPHSGKPDELLDYEEINSNAIIKIVKQVIS